MPPKKNLKSEIPEGVPQGLWDILLSIKADTAATSLRVDTLEARVEELEEQQTEESGLTNKVQLLTSKVEFLTAKLEKLEKKNYNFSDEIDDIRAQSMKENLIINFDKHDKNYQEAYGEDSIEIVRAFLRNILGMNAQSLYMPVAHRIGKKTPNNIRAIIVKLPVAKDRDMILKQTSRLKNTQHSIMKQLTARQRERKQFVLPEYKLLKENPDKKARLADDKLFVNGNIQKKFLRPVLPTTATIDTSLKLHIGNSITDSGSSFTGFVARVSSMQNVADILHLAKEKPAIAAANHLIYAYRFGDTEDTIRENFDSDGDYGVGLHLLQHMKTNGITDLIMIVSRNCSAGFTHIGRRRMEHAVKVCEKACEEMVK